MDSKFKVLFVLNPILDKETVINLFKKSHKVEARFYGDIYLTISNTKIVLKNKAVNVLKVYCVKFEKINNKRKAINIGTNNYFAINRIGDAVECFINRFNSDNPTKSTKEEYVDWTSIILDNPDIYGEIIEDINSLLSVKLNEIFTT